MFAPLKIYMDNNDQSLEKLSKPGPVASFQPDIVIKQATQAAKALKAVLDSKPRPVTINGQQYLEYEDWQTLGRFYGFHVRTLDPEPVEIFAVKGAKAKAIVYNPQGVELGGAEAYCLSDEKNWAGKPWYQLGSMAQTRAGAKALRNLLAWVVVLAGYAPTPAEEIPTREKPLQFPDSAPPPTKKCSICGAVGKWHRKDCPQGENEISQ